MIPGGSKKRGGDGREKERGWGVGVGCGGEGSISFEQRTKGQTSTVK